VKRAFAVWAPDVERVELEIADQRHPMAPSGRDGWWEAEADAAHGTDYAFRLDGGELRPDPRSAGQPRGVHGPSRVVDHRRFTWSDDGWQGRDLLGSVIYELHVGTFSPEGTFDGVIRRLDHLAELGITHVELLPVAAFPGDRGWGYDGAALFAVHEPYGGSEGLKRFVDAAHARGLGVLLDVVYNHLGPDGNYLREFGPYFTVRHHTPWGDAVNFDDAGSDEVRRFVIDNALMWLRDYHIDGLRLDAVHAILDLSALHILEELGASVHALADELGRPLLVIAESDLNDPRLVTPRESGGYGLDAQWSDDFHHALHATLTGERHGYYEDFTGLSDVATALRQAYVYAGRHSRHRGRRHGREPIGIPGRRFLGYLQNHDQVGNRARGERIGQLVSPGLAKVGAALVLSSPFTPMLFMGEEWNASGPWQYFTDHEHDDLAESVRVGRQREFATFGWRPEEVPDPQDPATFERSRLRWNELEREEHAAMLEWYRRLIRLRREQLDPADDELRAVLVRCSAHDRWLTMRRGSVLVVANLARRRQVVPLVTSLGNVLLASEQDWRSVAGGLDLPAESVVIVEGDRSPER
jgi:maltooligosyltrehalose trehalohydrolase